MGSPLQIFASRAYLPDGVAHIPLLFPFWGMPSENLGLPDPCAYEALCAQGVPGIRLVPWHDATHVVLPFDWTHTFKSPECQQMADALRFRCELDRKDLVIFYWSDDSEPVEAGPAFVFRTSMLRSKSNRRREFCVPAWLMDPLREVAKPVIANAKGIRPRVGFCGQTSHGVRQSQIRRAIKNALRRQFERIGAVPARLRLTPLELRSSVLRTLAEEPKVDTCFVEREAFFGGAVSIGTGEWDLIQRANVRREYIDNIVSTDYTICVRGAGNFSHRYFETLACGRIPFVVDTDLALPFESIVDWRSRGPWVAVENLGDAADVLLDFHDSVTAPAFVELQLQNRKLFEEYLSPEGFFRNFHLHFEEKSGDRGPGD